MSISDVAKLAGVSSATVSRVINNHPRVAPKTVQSVRAAMQNLGYTPSDRRPGPKPTPHVRRTARAIAFLVLGTSRTRATPAFQDLLRGVSMGAARHELNLNFHHVADPQHPPLRAIEQGIDGVLLHGAAPMGDARERLRHLPTVWLMGNVKRPDWGDQVLPDAYQIGEIAAKYLLERGHKRLAFFNLEAGHWSLRIYGHAFQMTAQDAGAHVERLERVASVTSTEYWHDHSVEAVEALVKQYLALSPRPTGIFVADDMQVAMLQPALQKHGVELGPDAEGGRVDVISCNNEQPYLVGLQPRPAVVDIRVESIGRRGIEQLLWRLDHPEVSERIITAIEPTVLRPEDVARAVRTERAAK